MSNLSVGNDIIDWQYAKTQLHKLKPRSLEKLFNTPEIHYIDSHEVPILAFWHLWSVKESAYKAWQRQKKAKPTLNAKSFVCQSITPNATSVFNTGFSCKVQTIYTSDYLYSECLSKNHKTQIFKTSESFSHFKTNWLEMGLKIIKNDNHIPNLYDKHKHTYSAISLSHDKHLTAITGSF